MDAGEIEEVRVVGEYDGSLDWFKYSQSLGDFCASNDNNGSSSYSALCLYVTTGIYGPGLPIYAGIQPCGSGSQRPDCFCFGTALKSYNADSYTFECVAEAVVDVSEKGFTTPCRRSTAPNPRRTVSSGTIPAIPRRGT